METASKFIFFMNKKRNNLKGQVVVEYILVIAAVIGMALTAYTLLKKRMKTPLQTFKDKVEKVESDSARAGKPIEAYYNKMEFKKQ